MPGELPAPRPLTRRPEDLQAVPFRVEQVGQLRLKRPQHVFHGDHRDHFGVPRYARAGLDQLVREPALAVVERTDGQAVTVARGQERPLPALVAEAETGPL